MKNKLFIILMVFIGGMSVSAQESSEKNMSFSLNEAIDYSFTNNTEIKNAGLDLEYAKKEVWKTTAIGLPQVNGKLDYQHLPGELPRLSFPDGSGGMQEIALGVRNSSTYSVTVSQLVFSGEYIVGLQAAKTFLQLSQNSLEKSMQTTKANVSSAYFTILLLESSKATLDSSLISSNQVLKETKALMEAGFLEETDLEQFSIVTNTISNGIKSIERQIELAYRLFKLNVGIEEDVEVKLTQTIQDLLEEVEFTALLNQDFELENNLDYKMLLTSEKILDLTLKREKSKFLPTLSAFYLYQDKTRKADFDITFNHILGLSVGVPIFSSGQRLASVGQAKIDLEKSVNTRTQVGESLNMAVEQARGDFQTAFESFSTQQRNVELSKRIYEKTLIKYKEGVSSSLDVTQANNQYLEAVNAYNSSIMEVLNAKTSLEIILSN